MCITGHQNVCRVLIHSDYRLGHVTQKQCIPLQWQEFTPACIHSLSQNLIRLNHSESQSLHDNNLKYHGGVPLSRTDKFSCTNQHEFMWFTDSELINHRINRPRFVEEAHFYCEKGIDWFNSWVVSSSLVDIHPLQQLEYFGSLTDM